MNNNNLNQLALLKADHGRGLERYTQVLELLRSANEKLQSAKKMLVEARAAETSLKAA